VHVRVLVVVNVIVVVDGPFAPPLLAAMHYNL